MNQRVTSICCLALLSLAVDAFMMPVRQRCHRPVTSLLAIKKSLETSDGKRSDSQMRLESTVDENVDLLDDSSPMENEKLLLLSQDIFTEPNTSLKKKKANLWQGLLNEQNSVINFQNPSKPFARFLTLVAAAIYSTNPTSVKVMNEHLPFEVSAVLRFSLAVVVIAPAVFGKQQEKSQDQLEATLGGMEVGFWYSIGFVFQAIGLQTVGSGKTAFFAAMSMLFVPILDSIFLGRKMGGRGIASILLAVLGLGLMQSENFLTDGISFSRGDVLSIMHAAFFGIGYFRLEAVASKYPSQAEILTFGQVFGVALCSIFYCAFSIGIPEFSVIQGWLSDTSTIGIAAWAGIVATAFPLFLETVALRAISASELTLLMSSMAIFGSAFAYITLGEVLSPPALAGGLLILSGCVLTAMGGKDEKELLERLPETDR
mmetsp:Transcript_2058/g.2923  ORF Transcript_2058/g.2923 Transcript_2058/m.2923 type:complete len:430 (+) Transcript_2058:203-1492(+)